MQETGQRMNSHRRNAFVCANLGFHHKMPQMGVEAIEVSRVASLEQMCQIRVLRLAGSVSSSLFVHIITHISPSSEEWMTSVLASFYEAPSPLWGPKTEDLLEPWLVPKVSVSHHNQLEVKVPTHQLQENMIQSTTMCVSGGTLSIALNAAETLRRLRSSCPSGHDDVGSSVLECMAFQSIAGEVWKQQHTNSFKIWPGNERGELGRLSTLVVEKWIRSDSRSRWVTRSYWCFGLKNVATLESHSEF